MKTLRYYTISGEALDRTEIRPLDVEWIEVETESDWDMKDIFENDWPSEVEDISLVSHTRDGLTVWKVTNTDGNYYGIVERRCWFAVMKDRDDDDWGTGSYDLDEAKSMARQYGPDAYIAVIEESENPVCVDEIEQADF